MQKKQKVSEGLRVARARFKKKKKSMNNVFNINTWHGIFVIAFVFGVAVASIWMANMHAFVVTRAASTTGPVVSSEVRQIRDQINNKKAKWVAADTEITRLSPEERKMRVVPKEKLDAMIPKVDRITPAVTATAPNYDWRNTGATTSDSFVTPVKNQGNCGSCWAFADTATAESAVLLKNKTTYSQNPLDLSEQVMVSCSGAGSCSGGSSASASNFLSSTGLPAESCYQYTATNGSCSSACANWQTATSKISNYSSIASDVTAMKNAIATYGPIVATMYVYSDFYSYSSGVYSYVTGTYQGAHALSVVGYDDNLQAFIVKNSWGAGWGEGGFFKIAYSEVGGTSRFGYSVLAYNTNTPINPPTPDTVAPTASLTSPTSGATLSGTTNVTANASDDIGVSKVEFYLDNNLQYTDTAAPYNFNWNTLTASNAGHSLMAKAYDAANNAGSSISVDVAVYNVPDTTQPQVKIVAPVAGSTVTGNVSVKSSATDNVGVTAMKCFIDNNLVASSTTGTLSATWNARKTITGTHTIRVDAMDAAGNTGSTSISVNVANSAGKK